MSGKQVKAQRRADWTALPVEVQQARVPGTNKVRVTHAVCVALLRQLYHEAEPDFYPGWADEMLDFTLERFPGLVNVVLGKFPGGLTKAPQG